MDAISFIAIVTIIVLLVAAVYQRATKKQCPACKTWGPRAASRCRKCQATI